MSWIIGIAAVLVIVILAGGAAGAHYITCPHPHSYSECIPNGERWDTYSKLTETKYTVKGEDGYEMNTVLVPAEKPSDRYVIIAHGYTVNRMCSIKYILLFRKLGFNCIAFDERGHGDGAVRQICRFGLTEASDMNCQIRDAYSRYGENIVLGLHGESMGAAVTVSVMKYRPRVAFAVSDCGYADLMNVLKGKIRLEIHFPEAFYYPCSLMNRLMYGYFYGSVRPIDALEGCTVPFLFVHGTSDSFINFSNAARMHEKLPGSELFLVQGAEHADSVNVDPEGYESHLREFLKKLGISVEA